MRINDNVWQEYVNNNKDPYGGACVKIANKVMNYLDSFTGEFNIGYSPDLTTPHGIICHVDDEGITGFMAGAVTSMVTWCHSLGWKFYLADKIHDYNFNKSDEILKYKNQLIENKLTSEIDIDIYIEELLGRYIKNLNKE